MCPYVHRTSVQLVLTEFCTLCTSCFEMLSHRQIIELWPSRADFARELNVGYQTARQWYARDGIPVRYWQAVVSAAKDRGIEGVSIEVLLAGKADGTPGDDEKEPEFGVASESSPAPLHIESPVQREDDDDVMVCQGELKLAAAE